MDLASLIGLLGAVGAIIALWSPVGVLLHLLIHNQFSLCSAELFAVMYANPLPVFLGSFGAMAKAFLPPVKKLDETVERMVELAGMARKDGMMALEGQPVPDKFFEKGMQMLVDGADEQKLVKQLKSEIASMKSRHEINQGVVQGWVDVAPAMGMIGTLIGLVLMLGNMGDPKSIGPAMAVALLTTLYGAFVANVLFAPIKGKLEYYTDYEVVYREMVLEGLRGIARSESQEIFKIRWRLHCLLNFKVSLNLPPK